MVRSRVLVWGEAGSSLSYQQTAFSMGTYYMTRSTQCPAPSGKQNHMWEHKNVCIAYRECPRFARMQTGVTLFLKIMLLSLKPLWMLIWCRKREHLIFLFNVLVLKIKYGILTNCLEKNSLPLTELSCTGYHPYPWSTLIKAASVARASGESPFCSHGTVPTFPGQGMC